VRGDQHAVLEDPDLLGVALDLDDALPRGVGDAVEVAAHRDHALVADAPLDGEHGAVGDSGVRDQRGPLLGEVRVDDAAGGGVDAGVGDLEAPPLELVIEVIEVAEAPGQEEVLPDVAVGPLHLALGLGAIGSAGPGDRAVVVQQGDERAVVGDDPLGVLTHDRGLHPVVEQLGGRAAHGGGGVDVAGSAGRSAGPARRRTGPRATGCGRAPG
jgi:hypothetical protein